MTLLEKSLIVIFSLLLIATVINGLLVWLRPSKDWRELTLRIRTWWVIIVLFSFALLSPSWLALTFFALVSFMALKEFLTLVPSRQSDRMPLLWMFIAIPLNYWLIGIGWYGMFVVFIPVYVFLFSARMVIAGDTQGFLRTVSQLHWSLMTTVFAFSHVAFLLVLPADGMQTSALLVLFLVGLTEFNDIAQYLWGKSLGRIKVIPKVSPNKTLEGLLGGVATTALAATVLGPLLTPLSWPMALLAGVIIGVTGFCGDVVMSAIKRDIGVKDSGTLLPGHGGILDRLDSLIFTAAGLLPFCSLFLLLTYDDTTTPYPVYAVYRLVGHLAVAWSACPPPRATAEARAFDNRGKSQQPYGCFRLAFAFSAALPGFCSSGCCRGLFSAG